MRVDLIVALCGALIYVGKLLDDHYLTVEHNNRIVTSIQNIFEWFNEVRLPDIPFKVSFQLFMFWSARKVFIFTMAGTFLIAIMAAVVKEDTAKGWYYISFLIFGVSLLCIPFVYIGVMAMYMPSRKIFRAIVSRDQTWMKIKAPLFSSLFPIVAYLIIFSLYCLEDYVIKLTYGENFYSPTYRGPYPALWVMGLGIIPAYFVIGGAVFFGLFAAILIATIVKTIMICLNGIAKHLLHKTFEKRRPFSYVAAVFSVILAFAKVVEEFLK